MAMARLAVILTAVLLTASSGTRIGDEGDEKDESAVAAGGQDAPYLNAVVNFVLGKDPAGLKEKGITMGTDPKKPINCKGGENSGLGLSKSVIKCEIVNIHVKMPPPAPEHKPFVTSPDLLKLEKVKAHVECDTGAIMQFVKHQAKNTIYGWFGWDQSEYMGPVLCHIKDIELHKPIIYYETGIHKTDKDTTPDLLDVISADGYETSNVNQLVLLFGTGEDPEEIVEPLNGTEPVNWKDSAFRLNTLQAFANKREINYNRDFDKDLKLLIGSQAKGMLKLYLALGKLVRNIVYDTIKDDIGEAATATAGFMSKGKAKLTSLFNRASNDKCCCMKSDVCKKKGWSAGDNAIKFGFEFDKIKYCCKIRDNRCDKDKYKQELLPLMQSLPDTAEAQIIHAGSRTAKACPPDFLEE